MTLSDQSEPQTKQTISALWRLLKIILNTLDFNTVVQKSVDSVLTELENLNLSYRIIVLALVNKDSKQLEQISISQTEDTKKAVDTSPIPFKNVVIPLTEKENICIQALEDGQPKSTKDWNNIFHPVYGPEDALKLQETVGIKTSLVYPVIYHGNTRGVMIFSMVKNEEDVTDDEKVLIKNFTDIVGLAVQNSRLYTHLDQASARLVKANEQLHELDKLKDEFVSLASHELRTPMTAIKGSLSTILEGYAGEVSDQAKEFLTAAYNENDRLIRLINNLLNISRIEAGRLKFEIHDLIFEDVINEVIGNLHSAAAEKGLYLKYEKNELLPHLFADDDMLREILINIIGNAIKFTHRGGITVRAKHNDDKVTISITDTGSGIAEEDQIRLFKKFSQLQGNYSKTPGGTGLGLYICRKIIEGMDGEIWLESKVGVGSTFFFSLPISK